MKANIVLGTLILTLISTAGLVAQVPMPDLAVVRLSTPDEAAAGEPISLQVTIANRGTVGVAGSGPGRPGYSIDLVLSSDDRADVRLHFTSPHAIEDGLLFGGRISDTDGIAAGNQVEYSDDHRRIPEWAPNGRHYICAIVDSANILEEANELNNTGCVSLNIVGSPEWADRAASGPAAPRLKPKASGSFPRRTLDLTPEMLARQCLAPVQVFGSVLRNSIQIYGDPQWPLMVELRVGQVLIHSYDASRQGIYRFDRACPGRYELLVPANQGSLVRAEGGLSYRPFRAQLEVGLVDVQEDIELVPLRVAIDGQVTFSAPSVVGTVGLEIQIEAAGPRETTSTIVDASGRFSVQAQCCADYEIRPTVIRGRPIVFEPHTKTVETRLDAGAYGVAFEMWERDDWRTENPALARRSHQPVPNPFAAGRKADRSPEDLLAARTPMPSVVGLEIASARFQLRRDGFPDWQEVHIDVTDIQDVDRIATVARQSPSAGALTLLGVPVTLTTYRLDPRKNLVPNLVGWNADQAFRELARRRIPAWKTEIALCPPGEALQRSRIGECRDSTGKVVSQNPDGPAITDVIDVVELQVPVWPEPRPVPRVADGRDILEAANELRDSGFLTRLDQHVLADSDCDSMQIVAQDPPAGRVADYGSVVEVQVCFACTYGTTALGIEVSSAECDIEQAFRELTSRLGYPPLNGYLY